MTRVIGIREFVRTERKLARRESVPERQRIEALNFLQERPFMADVVIFLSRVSEPLKLIKRFVNQHSKSRIA